ncbi:uncharacterized protein V6R79_007551 [Siganus canaliculatus]
MCSRSFSTCEPGRPRRAGGVRVEVKVSCCRSYFPTLTLNRGLGPHREKVHPAAENTDSHRSAARSVRPRRDSDLNTCRPRAAPEPRSGAGPAVMDLAALCR